MSRKRPRPSPVRLADATTWRMRTNGVDPENGGVKYLETSFPHMVYLLEKGQIDAAFLPEPFLSLATTRGATIVAKESGMPAGLPQTGYYITADFLGKYPKTVAAFQRGLLKAQKPAAADRKEIGQALIEHIKISTRLSSVVRLPEFPVATDARRSQGLGDTLLESGYPRAKFDVNSLLTGVPVVHA